MDSELPLVTVNILSFNRRDELKHTLRKVYEQDYKNIEVIVVDNASIDGSPEMVKEEFPEVILIRLEKNIGIAGWNEGFKIAKGEYVLVLDDDSYPEKKAINLALKYAIKDSSIGIVSLNILLEENTRKIVGYKTPSNSFIGCGALLSKTALVDVGHFNDFIFLYAHEIEYSMRLYEKGYKIHYLQDAIVFHAESSVNREFKQNKLIDNRKIFYDFRNLLINLFLHFPYKIAIWQGLKIFLGRIIFGIKTGYLITILRAFLSFSVILPKILKNRMVLNKSVQEIYLNGKFGGGFFFITTTYGLKKPSLILPNHSES